MIKVIKNIIKKIMLYFLNKRIKEIKLDLEKHYSRLYWMQSNIHDKDILESCKFIKMTKSKINILHLELEAHEADREGLLRNE